MKNFIESCKLAIIEFFSGRPEEKSIDEELKIYDSGSTCLHDHFENKSDSIKPIGCLEFSNYGIDTINGPMFRMNLNGCTGLGTVTPSTKLNITTNKKGKTKSKPKKVLNITIIHNKKPITITEFSKISGIPYPVIKYHFYANNIKTSKDLKKYLKPETLGKVKVKI